MINLEMRSTFVQNIANVMKNVNEMVFTLIGNILKHLTFQDFLLVPKEMEQDIVSFSESDRLYNAWTWEPLFSCQYRGAPVLFPSEISAVLCSL